MSKKIGVLGFDNKLKEDVEITLEIIDLDDKANGIAKNEGIIFFVEDSKLGEIVQAKIKKVKKNYCICSKIKTIKESPFLNKDANYKNRLCGIYDIYDLHYDEQVKFKKNMIINNINRIAGENIEKIEFVYADKIYAYRNKIELKLDTNGKLSYFSRNTNSNVEIKDCIMVTNEINQILPKLQELINKHKLKGYDTSNGTGLVKNIIIRSTSLGEVQGVLVFNEEYDFKEFYKDLQISNIFDSFYVSKNTRKRNYKILELNHIFGKKKIQEDMGGYKFNISPKAFFQINKDISYKIYLKAKDIIRDLKASLLIDLYSGVSTTSIILSDCVDKIISVEISEEAILDAKDNAILNDVTNIEWLNISAEEAINKIDLKKENTVALFDPPRRGLDESIIEKIGKSSIDNIVYISCNPSTMARDVKRFKEYGFVIKDIVGFDQFVNTIEVESLIFLSK